MFNSITSFGTTRGLNNSIDNKVKFVVCKLGIKSGRLKLIIIPWLRCGELNMALILSSINSIVSNWGR